MNFLRNFFNRNNEELPKIEPVFIEMPQRQQPALSEAIEGKIEEPEIEQLPKRNTFFEGYRENYDNGFTPQNWNRNPNKDWKYRLGEGLGTVGRFIDSPLGRGVITAGLNKALGYDDSLLEGLQAYSTRQNNVTADRLYRNELKKYGYSDDDLAGIRGTITSDMYKNLANNAYKLKNLDQNTYVKLKNSYDKQLQNGILSPEQYQANMEALNSQYIDSQVKTMQAGEVQESNQTRNINSQIAQREKRLEQYEKQLELNEMKIQLTAQNSAERNNLLRERMILKNQYDKEKLELQREKTEAEIEALKNPKPKVTTVNHVTTEKPAKKTEQKQQTTSQHKTNAF